MPLWQRDRMFSILASSVVFALAAGKMLNNVTVAKPGYVVEAELGVTGLPYGTALRGRVMQTSESQLSLWGPATFVTLAGTKTYKYFTLGIGEVLYIRYDPTVEWKGVLYPHDLTHITRTCDFCGYVTSLEYGPPRWGRVSLEVQYYAVTRMSPTFQGTVVLIKYTL